MAIYGDAKVRVAGLLWARYGEDVAARFYGRGQMVSIPFGDYAEVLVSQSFGGDRIEIRVNWSAIGSVDFSKAYHMSFDLQKAAELAEALEHMVAGA